jgi:hypothetical protein
MISELYRTYQIRASAERDRFTDKWIASATIVDSANGRSVYMGSAPMEFASEEEAEKSAMEQAKKWVDEHPTL